MKNTQVIADRIKSQAKSKGLTVKLILESCELGVNTVTKMNNGTDIFSQNLLKIADYLDCSVDYLLGRTNNPNVMTDTYINGNNSVQAVKTGNVTINGNNAFSDKDIELLKKINALNLDDYVEMINIINKKIKEK